MLRPHLLYARYVARHKWYVFQECLKYGLVWQGITHDWSKLLPDERIPYAEYFYGNHPYETLADIPSAFISFGAGERDTKAYWRVRFDEAWNLHQKRQPHHWQFWLLLEDSGAVKCLPMPDKYRKEMLADWRGASRAIKGFDDTFNWYLANCDKMQLHPDTRAWVEQELGIRRVSGSCDNGADFAGVIVGQDKDKYKVRRDDGMELWYLGWEIDQIRRQ